MIPLTDLRPGNLVVVPKQDGTPKKIKSVSLSGFAGFERTVRKRVRVTLVPGEELEPILLSGAVLAACGMYYHDVRRYWQFSDLHTTSWWPVWRRKDAYFVFPFGENHGSLQVRTLHQLQNLFYVITGSELEINLEMLHRQMLTT